MMVKNFYKASGELLVEEHKVSELRCCSLLSLYRISPDLRLFSFL